MLIDCRHRPRRMRVIRRTGDHAPRLRDGVDLALDTLARTERRAVVVIAAPVPLTVPACAFERASQGRCERQPARRALIVCTPACIRNECVDRRDEKPRKPRAFAATFFADAVHAVVPVAGADERQPACTQRQTDVDRTRAVFVQTCLLARDRRLKKCFVLAILQRFALDEIYLLVEQRCITCCADVVRSNVRQPDAVVGHRRADTLPGRRQPPVLHITFNELT